eukprot:Lankesteria_metandrocarpae@DN1647_c0_g1_i1.p1
MKSAAAARLSAMRDRMKGAEFRWLNEEMYTTESSELFNKVQGEPELFHKYHTGYRRQASTWPCNPLEEVEKWIRQHFTTKHRVGDFGCGEAALAAKLKGWKIHSFDLVAANSYITPCNIAQVPLQDATLDLAIYCLSLMGPDWPSFLEEAKRLLKSDGHLIVVEVESRFTDKQQFINSVVQQGYTTLVNRSLTKYFAFIVFVKNSKLTRFVLQNKKMRDIEEQSCLPGQQHGAVTCDDDNTTSRQVFTSQTPRRRAHNRRRLKGRTPRFIKIMCFAHLQKPVRAKLATKSFLNPGLLQPCLYKKR